MGSPVPNPHIVQFADYVLDLETAELRRNGTKIILQDQPFQILTTLIESQGRLVTREELIKKLWPSGTFVDFDQSLNRAVGRLREALGDDAEQPRFVETFPRKGYRFIAAFNGVAAPTPPVQDRDAHSAKRKLKLWLGVAALLIPSAGVVGVLYYWLARKTVPFQETEITRLTNIGTVTIAAISPDGKYVAYATVESPGLLETSLATKETLLLRQVDTGADIQIVPAATVHYAGLTFSRAGDFLYVTQSETIDRSLGILYKMPTLGGVRKRLIVDVAIEYGYLVNPVALSPNGKLVAFLRDFKSKHQTVLMVANEDGSGEKEIAVRKWPEGFGGMVSWSPDGRTIATALNNSQTGDKTSLVEVSVQGGTEHPLTLKRWVWVPDLAWLPDGRGLIATAQERGFGPEQLVYISHANGDVRRITSDPNYYHTVSVTADASVVAMTQVEFWINAWVASVDALEDARPITSHGRGDDPAWSPDGTIVHWSYYDGNIWLIGADGSNPKQLTASSGASNFDPRVSPDGHYIVFVSDRTGTNQIWRMDNDGDNPKPLTEGILQAHSPAYSPDGEWVVYVKGGADKGVWKVPIRGGEPVRLTDAVASYPIVAPDGRTIAYVYGDPQGDPPDDFVSSKRGVAIMAFEGGPPIRSFEIPHLTAFRWGPGGHSFLYTKNEQGVDNFWSQPIAGGKPKQITHFKDQEIRSFDLSRDGRRVVMSRGTIRQDVVLVRDLR